MAEPTSKELLELFKYYSDLANNLRRLLVTQTFAWLAGMVYVIAEQDSLKSYVGFVTAITVAGSAFTLSLGFIYRYLHRFAIAIVERGLEIGKTESFWGLLKSTREGNHKLILVWMEWPDVIPVAAFVAATVAVWIN